MSAHEWEGRGDIKLCRRCGLLRGLHSPEPPCPNHPERIAAHLIRDAELRGARWMRESVNSECRLLDAACDAANYRDSGFRCGDCPMRMGESPEDVVNERRKEQSK